MQRRGNIGEESKQKAIELLHSEGCSCVITDGKNFRTFHQRGVKDLYDLLNSEPKILHNAFIADKVVGKGAAALMIVGGIESLYADTISKAAIGLFEKYDIAIQFGKSVPHIINRAGTGFCPIESLCKECETAEECLPLIKNFIENNAK